jgi:tight adherence protein C
MSDPLIVAVLGGGAVLTLFLGATGAVDGARGAQRRRLRQFVGGERDHGAPTRRTLGAQILRAAAIAGRPPLAAALGGLAGAALAFAIAGPGAVPLGAAGGAALGYVLPRIAHARGRARERRDLIAALPNALDLLALAADAGLGFDAAVAQVVARLEGPLAVELRRVLVELRIGRDRRLVLRELARRTALAETARVANAIVQADALGLPLARTFRELAQEMRVRRRQRAEEQARTAPIKMLFPMVLLIFPALFIVILGPAVPQIMEALNVGP